MVKIFVLVVDIKNYNIFMQTIHRLTINLHVCFAETTLLLVLDHLFQVNLAAWIYQFVLRCCLLQQWILCIYCVIVYLRFINHLNQNNYKEFLCDQKSILPVAPLFFPKGSQISWSVYTISSIPVFECLLSIEENKLKSDFWILKYDDAITLHMYALIEQSNLFHWAFFTP